MALGTDDRRSVVDCDDVGQLVEKEVDLSTVEASLLKIVAGRKRPWQLKEHSDTDFFQLSSHVQQLGHIWLRTNNTNEINWLMFFTVVVVNGFDVQDDVLIAFGTDD